MYPALSQASSNNIQVAGVELSDPFFNVCEGHAARFCRKNIGSTHKYINTYNMFIHIIINTRMFIEHPIQGLS